VTLERLAWHDREPPSAQTVERRLREEGVVPYAWSNGPHDRYDEHRHGYTKLLMCAAGSITFRIAGEELLLRPGEGFVLPPDTPHAAIVGQDGCTCLEGHR
jgi:quercetin dioxygenase-like cupin family protein